MGREKRPGERFLASLDILPTRDMSAAQDVVAACYAVLKKSGVHCWPTYIAKIADMIVLGRMMGCDMSLEEGMAVSLIVPDQPLGR